MRLLYVAASRAEDRLILSGALKRSRRSARERLVAEVDLAVARVGRSQASDVVDSTTTLQLQLTLNLADEPTSSRRPDEPQRSLHSPDSLSEAFPLIRRSVR
jgi:ATP-dependent exoDNAse (exonuclease V) beta subunit